MSTDVNPRLIRKINEGKLNKNIKSFIIEALREEFSHADQYTWQYTEFYKSLIEKHGASK